MRAVAPASCLDRIPWIFFLGFVCAGCPSFLSCQKGSERTLEIGRGKRPGPSYSCGAIGSSLRGVIAPPALRACGAAAAGEWGAGRRPAPSPRRELKSAGGTLSGQLQGGSGRYLDLAVVNTIPFCPQPPGQASSRQGRHLSWRQAAPQPKRTGRRQRVRFLATDAFGRPGPGRSPGRSLPSFCRYRKKGPAGQALEVMS